MNKFNVTMSILIVVVIGIFGYEIVKKANHVVATGDRVSVSYTISTDEDSYKKSASVEIGDNENTVITDDQLLGLKYGADFNYETTLVEEFTVDTETTIDEGTNVTIDGYLTEVTPKTIVEKNKAKASEEASEETSEETSEEASEEK